MSSDPLPSINLEFLPDWARSSAQKPFPFEDRGERPPRREDRQRAGGPRDPRDGGRSRPGGRPTGRAGRGRFEDKPAPFRRPPPVVRPPVKVSFLPEPRALQCVIQQIQSGVRAYPIFSLARMFLDKPERYHIRLQLPPPAKGANPALLFQCSICHAVAPERGEIVEHILEKHRSQFYQEERAAGEAPKGNFTCVAQCKLNGAILPPPNHHDYPASLMRLYRKNFGHMDFERFKESVVMLHNPEAVARWKEDASCRITFKTLQDPEAKPLASEAELQQHFRAKHAAALLREAATVTLEGTAARQVKHAGLLAMIREAWETEDRFPINLAGPLCNGFVKAGLQIFKGPRGMQFVGITRPKALLTDSKDLSPGIRTIVDYLKAHPGGNRKQLLQALAPRTGAPAVPKPEAPAIPAAAASPSEPTAAMPLLQDLHWLIREGYILEYHNGLMELVKKHVVAAPKAPSKSPQAPTPDQPV